MAPVVQEERVTLDIVKQSQNHYLYLPGSTRGSSLRFILDTGSDRSIIQKAFVPRDQIQPCEIKEYHYICHQVPIVGEASVTVILGHGQASLEVNQKFLVAENNKKSPPDLLAMDFLTDFQAKFVIDSEMEIMLNRTPRRPQESYLLPRLKVRLRFPKNNVSSLTFLVDTGGCTQIPFSEVQSKGLKFKKAYKIHSHEYLVVKDTLTMLLGDSSRSLKGAMTTAMHYYILGDASLKRTVIDLEDWTMTFRSGKGDIKLPLQKE